MCSEPPTEYPSGPSSEPSTDVMGQFEQIRLMVESEFNVEEGFVEHNVPTFYVKLREDSKEAFLRLTKRLAPLGLIPILRKKDTKIVLQTMPKPPTKPGKKTTNIILLLATVGTVFLAGYFLSPEDIAGALMFVVAIMAILGSHEMGHKLAANRHGVEATYPYFIPGIPPIGTFGAVIQQKSLPPNKDALFDVGASGPILGFIIALVVTLVGIPLSQIKMVEPGAPVLPTPILLQFIVAAFPPQGNVVPNGDLVAVIALHPLAFAGWVGMFVTLVNLVPAGMLDGGHVTRSFLGDRTRMILAYLAIALLFIMGQWFYFMALLALFFSTYRHPGPLDDVSKLTTGRKLAALTLVLMFLLLIDWFTLIRTLTFFLP